MKQLKKLYKLIFMALLVVMPFLKVSAADDIRVPIYVEWMYGKEKWANSPHKTNVLIEAQNDAPKPTKTSFEKSGDYIVQFNQPEFNKAGRYEYLIYQNNEDFEENGRTVTYDKKKYRLVFIVENGNDGLKISVFTYDNESFDNNDLNKGKVEAIKFLNNDPFIHRNDGSIVDPDNPYHPFNPNNPIKPNDPNSPYQPDKPNQPTDPTNPDRNEDNTPIYPTEPRDPDNPDQPINPSKPTNPNDNKWPPAYPPDPNKPSQPSEDEGDSKGEKEWPSWPWNPTIPDDDENIDSNKKPWWRDDINPDVEYKPENPPIDPTDPNNPTKPVDTTSSVEPWWWEILYPGQVFDPANPDKPVEKPPIKKPWWWDRLFPDISYNPDKAQQSIEDAQNNSSDNKDGADSNGDNKESEKDTDIAAGKNKRDEYEVAADKNRRSDITQSQEQQANKDNTSFLPWKINSKDKQAAGRVKTGIRSVTMWLIILLLAAYALYKLNQQKRKK